MLHLLQHFLRVSPVPFELIPVTIDPGFPEFDIPAIEAGYHCIARDLQWAIVKTEIAGTIRDKNTPGKYPCAFCARLRRGALYRIAASMQCNRIALGHHADDAIETLMLSSMFEGHLVALPPVVKPIRYRLTVIRPLIRVWEEEIETFSRLHDFPRISCGHEGSSGGKRAAVKQILSDIELRHPGVKRRMLASLQSVNPKHFLDKKWL